MVAVFRRLLCVQILYVVINVIHKIRLNAVNNLKIAARFTYRLNRACGGGVRLHNTVVGNGYRLMPPLVGLSYYSVGRRNRVLCGHIGVAVQLNALFALVLILFGVFLQKRHGSHIKNKLFFIIIKFI